jgi:hypothetical protein
VKKLQASQSVSRAVSSHVPMNNFRDFITQSIQ